MQIRNTAVHNSRKEYYYSIHCLYAICPAPNYSLLLFFKIQNSLPAIMKKIISVLAISLLAVSARAQIVTCGSPFANFGLPVTFCGYVKGATRDTIGKKAGVILFLCGEYPNQGMTIVLKDDDGPLYPDLPETWIGKRVCATGTVQTYKGKYVMTVKKRSELTGR